MKTLNKVKTVYTCQSCGYQQPKWTGKCLICSSWNTFIEEKVVKEPKAAREITSENYPRLLSQLDFTEEAKISSGISEWDRVLGGGMVEGGVVLLGGDPGIGKSTLLFQVAEKIAQKNMNVLYVSGEESLNQIKLRSDRLKIKSNNLKVLVETNLDSILDNLRKEKYTLVIIDTIQTAYSLDLESAPGSISQLRECAFKFIEQAKSSGSCIFLIGHVTKDGFLAGPKVLEHMVDTVLYFEGEKSQAYRVLRSSKNRSGSASELGIFQMQEKGLVEIENPSVLFLSERASDVSGCTIVSCLEGSRPLFLELQALVTPSSFGLPQRVCSGIDQKRLYLLIALLEKRLSLSLKSSDVFVNLVGGVRIEDPALDLGIVGSLFSSYQDIPCDYQTVLIGEVGLGGEVRSVSHIETSVKEAAKL